MLRTLCYVLHAGRQSEAFTLGLPSSLREHQPRGAVTRLTLHGLQYLREQFFAHGRLSPPHSPRRAAPTPVTCSYVSPITGPLYEHVYLYNRKSNTNLHIPVKRGRVCSAAKSGLDRSGVRSSRHLWRAWRSLGRQRLVRGNPSPGVSLTDQCTASLAVPSSSSSSPAPRSPGQ